MRRKEPIEILKKIKKVSAPPGLYQKIEVQITQSSIPTIAISWVVAASIAVIFLLSFNILLINSSFEQSTGSSDLQTYFEEIHLGNTHLLYYE